MERFYEKRQELVKMEIMEMNPEIISSKVVNNLIEVGTE